MSLSLCFPPPFLTKVLSAFLSNISILTVVDGYTSFPLNYGVSQKFLSSSTRFLLHINDFSPFFHSIHLFVNDSKLWSLTHFKSGLSFQFRITFFHFFEGSLVSSVNNINKKYLRYLLNNCCWDGLKETMSFVKTAILFYSSYLPQLY